MTKPRVVAVVVNPHARGGAGELADGVVAGIVAAGAAPQVLHTAPSGSADPVPGLVDLDGRAEIDAVVAVGGDGTLRTVAEAIARAWGSWPNGLPDGAAPAGPPLFVVPGGTGNSVYRELWGDADWRDVLAAALSGRARRRGIDLYRIVEVDTAVLLGASAGFFRWTLDATRRFPDLEGRELYLAAGAAVAQELEPYRGSVDVDGVTIADGPIMLAAVGGAPRRSGTIHILPGSDMSDGLLDVCVLCAGSREEFFELMGKAVDGAHVGTTGAVFARGRQVVLRSHDGDLAFEHDGEILGARVDSVTIQVVPHAVAVGTRYAGA